MSWTVIIETFDSAGNQLRDMRANFKSKERAMESFEMMKKEFSGDHNKVVSILREDDDNA